MNRILKKRRNMGLVYIRKVVAIMKMIIRFLTYRTSATESLGARIKIVKPTVSKPKVSVFAAQKIIISKDSRMYQIRKGFEDGLSIEEEYDL